MTGSCSPSPRPTATRRSSTVRERSSSTARSTGTPHSASASTAALGRTLRAWNCASLSKSGSSGFRCSASTSSPQAFWLADLFSRRCQSAGFRIYGIYRIFSSGNHACCSAAGALTALGDQNHFSADRSGLIMPLPANRTRGERTFLTGRRSRRSWGAPVMSKSALWRHRRQAVAPTAAGLVTVVGVILSVHFAVQGVAHSAVLPLCGEPGTAQVPVSHVIVVMLENRSYRQVVGSQNAPYQTGLASQCGSATAMFGATHTSAANYLATSAGEFPASSPPGCGSVSKCADGSNNLYAELDSAGLSWRGYMESMPSACYGSTSSPYKIGHNPILFYTDLPKSECLANDLPVADLTAPAGAFWNDLQNQTLPAFSWVSPNMNNDADTGGSSALQAAD